VPIESGRHIPGPASEGPDARDETGDAFAALLDRRGFICAVEVLGTVALVTPVDPKVAGQFGDTTRRHEILALGRGCGLTHVAVVLTQDG
jgi:hypothetical protein